MYLKKVRNWCIFEMDAETCAPNAPIASPSWPVYGQIVRERKIKRSTHAHVSTCSVSLVVPRLQVPARGHSCWNSSPMILAPLTYRSSHPRIIARVTKHAWIQIYFPRFRYNYLCRTKMVYIFLLRKKNYEFFFFMQRK